MNTFKNLLLPLSYKDGSIVDGSGKTVIKANRDSNSTPLVPYERDAILKVCCELLNEAFQYDKIDQLLKKLGYSTDKELTLSDFKAIKKNQETLKAAKK